MSRPRHGSGFRLRGGRSVSVRDEHATAAAGGELAVRSGHRLALAAADPRGLLAFGIGDLPGLVAQRPRNVPDRAHQTFTAASRSRWARDVSRATRCGWLTKPLSTVHGHDVWNGSGWMGLQYRHWCRGPARTRSVAAAGHEQ